MPQQKQVDPHLLAIEVNALRMAEIATLRRECAFWRERCLHLEAVLNLPAHKVDRRVWPKQQQTAARQAAVAGDSTFSRV